MVSPRRSPSSRVPEKRVIEPGVLALGFPGGVAFIDEAHALDLEGSNLTERLNTALEFQEVPMSIIGGGKVTTKCPVIFVANPKKGDNTKFDRNSHLTYSQQAGMPASTMSRLDCPVVLLDELSDEQKEEVERAMAALQNMSGHYRENAEEEGILRFASNSATTRWLGNTPMSPSPTTFFDTSQSIRFVRVLAPLMTMWSTPVG